MRQKLTLFLGLSLFMLRIHAQHDPIILTINGEPVTKSEFEYIYNKNNGTNTLEKRNLDEYVDLFINFKLKVAEAKNQGYHHNKAYIDELEMYKKQLAAPYMTDKENEESLIEEAYSRMKEDVDVSHILIKTSKKDTLAASEKIWEIYNRLKKGEDFGKLAQEYSECNSSASGGHLGYLTAFMTVYPFETMAYNTPVGEISKPFLSSFGYHIVKVHDRRKNRGSVRVAHIFKKTSPANQAIIKQQIDSVYQTLKNGSSFAEAAKHFSDDMQSGSRGGDIGWVNTGYYPAIFENAAFALQHKDELSPVIEAPYGYHIIKLLDKKELASYDELHDDIKNKVMKDERSSRLDNEYIEKLKDKHNFKANNQALLPFYQIMQTQNESEIRLLYARMDAPLYSLKGITYPQSSFIEYFEKEKLNLDNAKKAGNKRSSIDPNIPAKDFVDQVFAQYAKELVINEEEALLEKEYPEYRNLLKEYSDGLLLFEISNEEVWNKASTDIQGLEKFFNANRENYTWSIPRFRGKIVYCTDKEILAEAEKLIKNLHPDSIDVALRKKFNADKNIRIKIENGLYAQGANKAVDAFIFKTGSYQDDKFPTVSCIGELVNAPQSYKDIRGPVTADYQNYLEEKWIDSLRKKYNVVINHEVLKTVKSN
jgi:peptidyl-prolyl cis-trans isomerase SurA